MAMGLPIFQWVSLLQVIIIFILGMAWVDLGRLLFIILTL